MYSFTGKWITDGEFYRLKPRGVFSKQLERKKLDCSEHRNCHILFRKKFTLECAGTAKMYITADDYYKLYINGRFVSQGPAPSYHFRYNYNVIDVTEYLHAGENTIAVHTLYQGLINRVGRVVTIVTALSATLRSMVWLSFHPTRASRPHVTPRIASLARSAI